MSLELWSAVDLFIGEAVGVSDPVLEAALADSAAAGLPAISVSAAQGKFLHLLARIAGARRILEIGTLGGYSTIWLARGMAAGGRVVTLELEPKHAEVARGNLERAGLGGVVELRLGPASESLAKMVAERVEPFDLVFIDADKVSTLEYFEWSLKLTGGGSVIVVDNVVRKGAVADARSEDASVLGIRRFFERVNGEERVSATVIQTVGSKGYDGFAVLVVNG